jgi:hypothetical protein
LGDDSEQRVFSRNLLPQIYLSANFLAGTVGTLILNDMRYNPKAA